jgi:hyperosmotically inducible protein
MRATAQDDTPPSGGPVWAQSGPNTPWPLGLSKLINKVQGNLVTFRKVSNIINMKQKIKLLTGACLASLLTFTVLAQDSTNRPPPAPDTSGSASVTNDVNSATTDKKQDANNSARNVRDRNNQTLTPGDQSNNPADRETTRQIRKAIIAAKDMSLSGRNVKIVTAAGKVTLRGPVASDQEKQTIGEFAAKVAGTQNVDNQLEVKLSPTGRQ